MPCLAQVSLMSFSARAADSREPTIQPTAAADNAASGLPVMPTMIAWNRPFDERAFVIDTRVVARVREFDTQAALSRAADVFRDRGFGETSMRDLAAVTGVAVGSLYTAFGSKDGLYRAALAQYGEDLGARAQRLLDGGGARAALRGFLLDHVAEVTSDPHWPGCLLVGAAQERLEHDPVVGRQVRDGFAATQRLLAAVIRRGQAAGDLRAEVDAEAAAEMLLLVLQGVRVAGTAQKDRAALSAAVDVALSAL